ncbi:penicillin-binding protein activator [bacterium]|nr:penicillin-binding protein activator [candidate division CSSED10-310 bacterium]
MKIVLPHFVRCLICLFILGVSGCVTLTVQEKAKQAITSGTRNPQQAIAELEQLLSQNPIGPETPEMLYQLGRLYQSVNNRQEAMARYSVIIDNYPSSMYSQAALIEIIGQDATTDPEIRMEQLKTLKNSLNNVALASRADYYLGEIELARENYKAALTYFRNSVATRTDPLTSYIYWLRIGTCERKLGYFAEAERDLNKSLSLSHHNPVPSTLEISRLYLDQNEYLRALEISFSVLDKTIGDGELLEHIMSILKDKLTSKELETLAGKYSSREPGYLIQRERIRRWIESGDLDQARYALSELLFRYPDRTSEIMNLQYGVEQLSSVNRHRIGLLTPLSGSLSIIGQNLYRGSVMAVDDFRSNNPHVPMEIVVRDTKGMPINTVSAYQDLAENEKVIAVIGPVKSACAEAIAELSGTYHLPTLSPGCSDKTICSRSEYLYRLYPSPENEASIGCRYLIDELGYRRFACIYPDIEYGRLAFQGLVEALNRYGGELVFSVAYPENVTNMSYLLTGLKSSLPDVIFIPDEAVRAAQVAGQVRYQEVIEPIFMGTSAWEDPSITAIGGTHLEQSIFVSEYPLLWGIRKDIENRYRLKYGELPDMFALRAYEATFLVLDALASGIKYRDQLQFNLHYPAQLEGINGVASFDKNGHYQPTLLIYKIADEKINSWAIWQNETFEMITEEVDRQEYPPGNQTETHPPQDHPNQIQEAELELSPAD